MGGLGAKAPESPMSRDLTDVVAAGDWAELPMFVTAGPRPLSEPKGIFSKANEFNVFQQGIGATPPDQGLICLI